MGRKKKIITEFQYHTADPFLASIGFHGGRGSKYDYRFSYLKIEKKIEEMKATGDEGLYDYLYDVTIDDFFAFCYFILNLPVNNPFWIARCYELQDEGIHMKMDLWARQHGKTLLKSEAYMIWRVARNPDERIGYFSNSTKLSMAILGAVKTMIESNEVLPMAFPDSFWKNPKKEARSWAKLNGLFCKQSQIFKEPTFSAWGLVDKMPVGYGFTIRDYDDVVDEHTVSNKTQVEKAMEAFRLSDNLGPESEKTINGTRYHPKDPYHYIMANDEWDIKLYPSEVVECEEYKYGHKFLKYEGKIGGIPVMRPREVLDKMLKEQGRKTYAAQNLQKPEEGAMIRLHEAFLRFVEPEAKPFTNKVLIIDTARKDAKRSDLTKSDYTCMWIVGMDFLRNFHVHDCIRDRLSLSEKWDAMAELVRKWEIKDCFLERHGSNEETQYYEEQMSREGLFFAIKEINTKTPKNERMENLTTLFFKQRIIFPRSIPYKNKENEYRDLMIDFIEEEYKAYPFMHHDDMMDCLANIMNPIIAWQPPTSKGDRPVRQPMHDPLDMSSQHKRLARGWRAR